MVKYGTVQCPVKINLVRKRFLASQKTSKKITQCKYIFSTYENCSMRTNQKSISTRSNIVLQLRDVSYQCYKSLSAIMSLFTTKVPNTFFRHFLRKICESKSKLLRRLADLPLPHRYVFRHYFSIIKNPFLSMSSNIISDLTSFMDSLTPSARAKGGQ